MIRHNSLLQVKSNCPKSYLIPTKAIVLMLFVCIVFTNCNQPQPTTQKVDFKKKSSQSGCESNGSGVVLLAKF